MLGYSKKKKESRKEKKRENTWKLPQKQGKKSLNKK